MASELLSGGEDEEGGSGCGMEEEPARAKRKKQR